MSATEVLKATKEYFLLNRCPLYFELEEKISSFGFSVVCKR